MLAEIELRASKQIGCSPEDVAMELKRIADGLDRDRPAARKVLEILNALLDQYDALKGEDVRASLQCEWRSKREPLGGAIVSQS
jgi:hypothetical protein